MRAVLHGEAGRFGLVGGIAAASAVVGGPSVPAGRAGAEGLFGVRVRWSRVWLETVEVDVVDVDGPLREAEGEGEGVEVVAGLAQALDVSQVRHLIIINKRRTE